MSAPFKTVKAKSEKKRSERMERLMGFREWCEYVYDPLQRAKDLDLTEDQRKAILESVEERCSSIPKLLKESYPSS